MNNYIPQFHIDVITLKGLRQVLQGFVVTMHEGTWKTGSQILSEYPRDLTYCLHKPECIVTTNPDRWVLIMLKTWHFKYHLVNVSILYLKYEFGAQSKSRFVCYSHCYVMWYPLMTGMVTSQCLWARNTALVMHDFTPLILACLKPL